MSTWLTSPNEQWPLLLSKFVVHLSSGVISSHSIINYFYCSVDFALYLTQHSPLVDNTFDLQVGSF